MDGIRKRNKTGKRRIALKKPATRLAEVAKWLQKANVKTMKAGNAAKKREPGHICGKQFFNHVSKMIDLTNGVGVGEDERGRIALSLIPYVGGWKVDDGVYVNRRRRIFGIVAANGQGMNLASFAVGIVIGCKGAKVYIVVGSSTDEKRLGRIPKTFQPFIDVVTNEAFFNLVAGRESAYQDICSAIDDVRRKRKTEKEIP